MNRLDRLVLVAALLYTAWTVAVIVAWLMTSDPWWLAPINLTTFWWSLPAVPLVLVAATHRRVAVTGLLVVPAMLWVWSYGTLFLPAGERGEAELRVASLNTHVLVSDVSHVISLVEEERPDVLLLQEVFPDRQAELADALTSLPYVEVVQTPRVGGVGVWSRFPIVEVRDVEAADARARATAVVVVDVDGQLLQVVPVHLISPCPSCGSSLTERVELEGVVRQAEVDAILQALDPDVPALVGGDFNSTERARPYRALAAAGFRDTQREAGWGPGFTWPNGRWIPPFLRIDWLVVRGLEPIGATVGRGGGSDHRPVIADLRFAGG